MKRVDSHKFPGLHVTLTLSSTINMTATVKKAQHQRQSSSRSHPPQTQSAYSLRHSRADSLITHTTCFHNSLFPGTVRLKAKNKKGLTKIHTKSTTSRSEIYVNHMSNIYHIIVIHLLYPLKPIQGRGAEPNPAVIGQQVGYTLDRSPVHHRTTQTQTRQTTIHTFS